MQSMMFRFSLYGFLKNQRYFDAFLVLAFLDKGLDFFQIGLLIGLRELTVNVLEVPSGAISDVFGHRRTMIVSFLAYIASFVVLGVADGLAVLTPGMILFGFGDAFRTGTHKTMIFNWLRREGREDERVRVYGYTRSWSKFGSAASVVLAAVIVLVTDSYSTTFFFAIAPYTLGIVNFLGYPRGLDEEATDRVSLRAVARRMLTSVRDTLARPRLRRLLAESMGFDGVFGAAKDYLQPALEALAIAWLVAALPEDGWSDTRRTALLVAPVYFTLFVLSGLASRRAHRVAASAGGEDPAARALWGVNLILFAALAAAAYFDALALLVVVFVALHVLQNLWYPVLVSRFDIHGGDAPGATLLSIESQSRRLATMIVAPLLGLAVDAVADGPGGAYWPVGAIGLVTSLAFLASARRRR